MTSASKQFGLATLLTDDLTLVDALTQVGEIYGTLVQYADDLRDAVDQPNAALTLPELLPQLAIFPLQGSAASDHFTLSRECRGQLAQLKLRIGRNIGQPDVFVQLFQASDQ